MKPLLALLVVATTLLAGCVVAPYDGGYYGGSSYRDQGHHRHHGHRGYHD